MKLDESKRNYWKEHLEAAYKNEKGVSDYCRQKNINTKIFYYWKKKLKTPKTNNTKDFIKSSFIPVAIENKKSLSHNLPNPEWLARFLNEFMRSSL